MNALLVWQGESATAGLLRNVESSGHAHQLLAGGVTGNQSWKRCSPGRGWVVANLEAIQDWPCKLPQYC